MYNKSTTTDCSDVHIIVDRATGEEPSQGVIGTLATLISERIPGVTVEWVDYPAVLMPYDQSTDTGIRMTKDSIRSYADKCANAKIVLLGYSQGAQVVGDVLCGGGGAIGLGPLTDPLEDEYQKRVVAAVQMGDPRFMANEPWDAGTSNTNGVSALQASTAAVEGLVLTCALQVFPRLGDRTCDKAGHLIKSYCDQFDPFCSVPGLDYDLHASYNTRYNEDAFQFVQGKVKYVACCIHSISVELIMFTVAAQPARRATVQDSLRARVHCWRWACSFSAQHFCRELCLSIALPSLAFA